MYNFLVKNGQSLAFIIGTVLTILFLVFAFTGMESFSMLPEEEQATTNIFNFGISSALGLIIIAFIGWILFSLFQIVTNLSGSLKGVLGAAVLVAVFLVAYFTGSVETSGPIYEAAVKQGVSDANSKFISGGITTALILVAVAALSFILFEIRNFFK